MCIMVEIPQEPVPATAARLQQTFESVKVINGAKVDGDSLNAFMGTEELITMGQHLVKHMGDEERWGAFDARFEPVDFVVAAYEVAHDQTVGESVETRVHVDEKLPAKLTFDTFISFWLPKIARVAYGEEYAANVRAIVTESRGS